MAKKKITLEEKIEEAIVKDVPYEVPKNWVWSNIKSINSRFTDGDWIVSSDFDDNGDIKLIQLSDIGRGVYLGKSNRFITKNKFDDLNCTEIKSNDILISRMAEPIGRSIIAPNINNLMITAVDISILSIDYKKIQVKYLNYLFNSSYFKESCEFLARGTTRLRITRKNMGTIPIPIPPLKEQERIVDKIESLFEKLDKAKELIEEVRDDFENRKCAILEKAFRGELTKEWRIKRNIEYSESWKSGIFEDLCVLSRGFDLPSRFRVKGEYSLVSSSGVIDVHNEFKMKAPGVVTGRSGSIGKVFYIENDFWPLNTTLYVKDFKYNNEKYVYYYLSRFDLKKYSSSTAVPTLNRNNFKNVDIIYPSLDEQKEIVRILDKLLEEESKIEELTALEEQIELIKKSILAKAFRGQLGTNCEEDESALELLKNILSEK